MVVDDSEEMRILLNLALRRDGRFELVGEARNGREAIDLCERLQPDLVVLDRQMPVMGGLEAIPHIRAGSPHAAIVLYTAAVEPETQEVAAAAGAIGVLYKSGLVTDVAHELAQILARRQAGREPDEVEVQVGPVPSSAARVWVANTRTILEAVTRRPDVIGGPVPDPILAVFERFLDAWEAVSRDTEIFFWAGRASEGEVRGLIEQWVRIDSMDDDTLAGLGCTWAPPEGRPFFTALTTAVVNALADHDEIRRLAERLTED